MRLTRQVDALLRLLGRHVLLLWLSSAALLLCTFGLYCAYLRLNHFVDTKRIACVDEHQLRWWEECAFYFAEDSLWFAFGRFVDSASFFMASVGFAGLVLSAVFTAWSACRHLTHVCGNNTD